MTIGAATGPGRVTGQPQGTAGQAPGADKEIRGRDSGGLPGNSRPGPEFCWPASGPKRAPAPLVGLPRKPLGGARRPRARLILAFDQRRLQGDPRQPPWDDDSSFVVCF